jgi:hypothetical protein
VDIAHDREAKPFFRSALVHNEAEHDAWMSSIEHIRSSPGFTGGKWPPRSGMTLQWTAAAAES